MQDIYPWHCNGASKELNMASNQTMIQNKTKRICFWNFNGYFSYRIETVMMAVMIFISMIHKHVLETKNGTYTCINLITYTRPYQISVWGHWWLQDLINEDLAWNTTIAPTRLHLYNQ